jgi:hypothetical protein
MLVDYLYWMNENSLTKCRNRQHDGLQMFVWEDARDLKLLDALDVLTFEASVARTHHRHTADPRRYALWVYIRGACQAQPGLAGRFG